MSREAVTLCFTRRGELDLHRRKTSHDSHLTIDEDLKLLRDLGMKAVERD